MRHFLFGLMAVALQMSAIAEAQSAVTDRAPPWADIALSADERARLLLEQMTEDEKFLLLKGYYGANVKISWIKPAPTELRSALPGSAGYVPGVPRLNIPSLHETDAGVGIANTNWMRPGDTATAFPSGLSNAATFSPETVYEVGRAIAEEARDRGYNVVLNGAINLAREPRGGRTFEYSGEDPLLAGIIVGNEIAGIQSAHVISTVKHYALNDQETGRGVLSAKITESAARESDLLAFELAIESGNPGAVMCAYNRVNGDYACENDFLLNQVLKRDWNYRGWVLSDWGAVHSTEVAAMAGLDQESASGFDRLEYFGAPLRQALVQGTLSADRFHDMVHRILRTMFAIGVMDNSIVPKQPVPHADVAERAAEQGIVLLKNDKNSLPLSKAVRSIAVIGARSDLGMLSGGGSSQVLPLGHVPDNEIFVGGAVNVLPSGARVLPLDREIYDPPSPLWAIRRQAPNALVKFESGADVAAAVALASRSDVAIVFVQQWMSEGRDVASLSLPGKQDALIDAIGSANSRTIVVLETGGPVLMPWLDRVPAVLEAWYSGNGGAAALAKILFGVVNPSGRLPITFPRSENQLPRPLLSDRLQSGRPFDVDYFEGADVGYRWFERQQQNPLFPFGFGISYTTFQYENLDVLASDGVVATIEVTNTGAREGSETVQLYAFPPSADAERAGRLVGWQKVMLQPGERRLLRIVAEQRLLAQFDAEARVWHVTAGDYRFAAGSSISDLRVTKIVTLGERTMKP